MSAYLYEPSATVREEESKFALYALTVLLGVFLILSSFVYATFQNRHLEAQAAAHERTAAGLPAAY